MRYSQTLLRLVVKSITHLFQLVLESEIMQETYSFLSGKGKNAVIGALIF
jgi:hypothetical protein